MTEEQLKRVRRAILSHEEWKAKWVKKDRCFSVEMVSPRGKAFTVNAYYFEVNKHLDATAAKIEKILKP